MVRRTWQIGRKIYEATHILTKDSPQIYLSSFERDRQILPEGTQVWLNISRKVDPEYDKAYNLESTDWLCFVVAPVKCKTLGKYNWTVPLSYLKRL